MSTVLTQGNYPGDWLKEEFSRNYCREEGVIASGQTLVSGQVVAIVTATGEYTAYDDDGSGGAEAAAGVLYFDVDAASAAKPGVILRRGPAVVSKAGLTWGSANDSTDITHGLADLLALGIVAREGV